MLQLLSTILTWNDDQREQVGLQKATGSAASSPTGMIASLRGRAGKGHARSGKAVVSPIADGLGENEVGHTVYGLTLTRADEGRLTTDVLGALDRVPASRGARYSTSRIVFWIVFTAVTTGERSEWVYTTLAFDCIES